MSLPRVITASAVGIDGVEYNAELGQDNRTVRIYRGTEYAGQGRLTDEGEITDCRAVLGQLAGTVGQLNFAVSSLA